MNPIHQSDSNHVFYLFGSLAEAAYNADDDTIKVTLPIKTTMEALPPDDFFCRWGTAFIDPDFPEYGTIGERLYRTRTISKVLQKDYYGKPTKFSILAEWQEQNQYCVRIGPHYETYRFAQDGKVTRSCHQDWETVAFNEPQSTSP
jgi:hypothetical protein